VKTLSLSILVIFISFSITTAAGHACCDDWGNGHTIIDFDHEFNNYHYHANDGIRFDIDGSDVIITCEKRRYKSDEVKITEDYKLYVNGDKVDLDDEQEELIESYHRKAVELDEEARMIGLEGAKIGTEGAKIGARAVSGVVKMLFLDFDEDEFEASIEREADRLEEKADKLEERAEALEDMADELENVHDEMADKIPELDELKWF
jgi:hypothetical protein